MSKRTDKEYTIDEPPIWLNINDVETMNKNLNETMAKIPDIQIKTGIELIKKLSTNEMSIDSIESIESMRFMCLQLRWDNKICLNCLKFDNTTKYRPCLKCNLVFYCSDKCEINDQPKHIKECGNPNITNEEIRQGCKFALQDKNNNTVHYY